MGCSWVAHEAWQQGNILGSSDPLTCKTGNDHPPAAAAVSAGVPAMRMSDNASWLLRINVMQAPTSGPLLIDDDHFLAERYAEVSG